MAENYSSGAAAARRRSSVRTRKKKKVTYSFFSRGVMDLTFFLIVMTLLVIGIIMMFSASYAKALSESGGASGTSYASKQMKMAALGVLAMLFFSYFFYPYLVSFRIFIMSS